jgi:putative intracellular protease/amidase
MAAAFLVMLGSLFAAMPGEKVLMVAREGNSGDLQLMLTQEAGVMREALSRAGFEVVVASVSGREMKAGTASLKPDMKISDVDITEYTGLLMPCLAIEASDPSAEVIALTEKAAAKGIPLAAQVSSVRILGRAGVLTGRKYANARPLDGLENGYRGTGVVQDGNIITSGVCPFMAERSGDRQDGTLKLIQKFISALGK